MTNLMIRNMSGIKVNTYLSILFSEALYELKLI